MEMSSTMQTARLLSIVKRSEYEFWEIAWAHATDLRRAWTSEDSQRHIRSQVEHCMVTAVDGTEISLPVQGKEVSLCCHSDSP